MSHDPVMEQVSYHARIDVTDRSRALLHLARTGGRMALTDTARGLIERYRLQPHPEGGWYREIYRSQHSLGALPGYSGDRTALTAIYFLLAGDDFSALHRVRSEEVWVFLAGAPLQLVLLAGEPRFMTLGQPADGFEPLVIVPPDTLQGARTLGEFTLVSCLVAPGFDFADFSLPSRNELLLSCPGQEALVRRFTRAAPAV